MAARPALRRLGAHLCPGLGDRLLDTQREVLIDPAREVAHPPIAGERVHVVAHALDEVAIVADDHERSGPAVEQVLERRQRVDVEVVRRLVQQQHVRLVHQQAHQLQASPLAAREVSQIGPLAVSAEAEALAQLAGRDLVAVAERDAAAHELERLEHAQAAIQLLEVLREVGDSHRLPAHHAAARRLELARHQPDHARLARPVDADERDALAGRGTPGDRAQQAAIAERERDVLELDRGAPEACRGEAHQLGAVARLGLVRDQRVGGVDPEARLGRARRRPALQPRELLAQQVLAAFLAGGGDALALGAREHPRRVATVVAVDDPVGDLPGLLDDGIEEPAIMGDDEQRSAPCSEVSGEPVDAFDVEVVRRLVEQQQLGSSEQQLGERDPPPLAA